MLNLLGGVSTKTASAAQPGSCVVTWENFGLQRLAAELLEHVGHPWYSSRRDTWCSVRARLGRAAVARRPGPARNALQRAQRRHQRQPGWRQSWPSPRRWCRFPGTAARSRHNATRWRSIMAPKCDRPLKRSERRGLRHLACPAAPSGAHRRRHTTTNRSMGMGRRHQAIDILERIRHP